MRSGKLRIPVNLEVDTKRARPGVQVSSTKGPILKSDDVVWLVGHPLDVITTPSLPTRRQAYLRFKYYQQHDETPISAITRYRQEDARFRKLSYLQIIATKVVDEIAVFWTKGCFSMKSMHECRDEILSIHNQWSRLYRSKNENNVGPTRLNSREEFVNGVDKIIDFSPRN